MSGSLVGYERLRKAWMVNVIDDEEEFEWVIHASTRNRARARAAWETEQPYVKIRAVRSKEHDHWLPHCHRIVGALNTEQKNILRHMVRWIEAPYGADANDKDVERLANLKILKGPAMVKWSGSNFYYLTDLGRSVAYSMQPTYPLERDHV